MSVNV